VLEHGLCAERTDEGAVGGSDVVDDGDAVDGAGAEGEGAVGFVVCGFEGFEEDGVVWRTYGNEEAEARRWIRSLRGGSKRQQGGKSERENLRDGLLAGDHGVRISKRVAGALCGGFERSITLAGDGDGKVCEN